MRSSLLHLAVVSRDLFQAEKKITFTQDHFEGKQLSFCEFAQLLTTVIFFSGGNKRDSTAK